MADRWTDDERAALVALLRERPGGLSWPEVTAEVSTVVSALAVWQRHVGGDLFDPTGESAPELAAAREDVRLWREAEYDFLTFMDEGYPARLRDVHQMPPVLFTRGVRLAEDVGVCVVGSRRATDAGLALAKEISRGLVDRSISVVSGLALGIDTAAHEAALASGGRTVAVIGNGIDRCYPRQNARLLEAVAGTGLVISQFWPAAPPSKQTFPMRNAVMSAYGRATVIVEAGETSGARIQARMAIEHGRPVVLSAAIVRSTDWGRLMVGRPGVHVFGTAEDALGAVTAILDAEMQADQWLMQAR